MSWSIENTLLTSKVLICILPVDSIESPVSQDKQKTYNTKRG